MKNATSRLFNPSLRIAVLIPCYNEGTTIAKVVTDFRHHLPHAIIYVYDNNSTDGTADAARAAGAIVCAETRQGKGFVVRRMFADIEADMYLLVDGDATYDAAAAPRLIDALLSGCCDMINGVRAVHTTKAVYRRGHVLGNKLLSRLVASIFGAQSRDMLSGYKAFSRRFVKTFPAISAGFEIETELLVHALDLAMPMAEVDTVYAERPQGSFSKLSTYKDGVRIMWMIVELVRNFMPLRFFAIIGVCLMISALLLAAPVIKAFIDTGLVYRLPTAVLSSSIMLLAFLSLCVGLILDSVAKGRREAKRMAYLTYPSLHTQQQQLWRAAEPPVVKALPRFRD